MKVSHHSFKNEQGVASNNIFDLLKDYSARCFYFGIDPTAPHLHLGHLIVIRLAIILIEMGWKCVVLVGGFTGQIGDPTDKKSARQVLNNEVTKFHGDGILSELKNVLQKYDVIYVNNMNWLGSLTLGQYLSFARYISVNKKVKLHTFADRLNNNRHLAMNEFLYGDLQAYDFHYLYEKYGCVLQIGGGDQWGNISSGLNVVGKIHQEDFNGICTPLLTVNGKKMGKTTHNAVNLYDNPYDLIGYLKSLPTDTKEQLQNIFHVNYVVFILRMLYSFDQAENYYHTYKLMLNCQDTKDIAEDWCISVESPKLSSAITKVFSLASNSVSKRAIRENLISINGVVVNDNVNLETNRIYKIVYQRHFIRYISYTSCD